MNYDIEGNFGRGHIEVDLMNDHKFTKQKILCSIPKNIYKRSNLPKFVLPNLLVHDILPICP